jgi:hypothetical protein
MINTYLVHPTNEQEQLLRAFLKSNQISFLNGEEKLRDCVTEDILDGRGNMTAANATTLEDFRKTMFYSG